jgi:hypothetical protein
VGSVFTTPIIGGGFWEAVRGVFFVFSSLNKILGVGLAFLRVALTVLRLEEVPNSNTNVMIIA